jgi:transposase
MPVKRTQYSEEFKAEAVALMKRDNRSYRQLSADLGVNSWTLKDWYNDRMAKKKKRKGVQKAHPPGVVKQETDEQRLARLERENARLQRENESLRMDREILKKAAAFFAKESE